MGTALHVARLSLLIGTFGLVTFFTTASAHSATGGEDVEWPFTNICVADDDVEWP
ncbi:MULTISPECIES: hypothetical protein [Streptomyces]|uniref:hypothetical protein n=1 Tax=Streptomyces TaxID=1883 RepID=UPI000AFCB7C3|nr:MULTISPECIES: hypothetical protein [Streptomyces]MDX2918365.1 hypothetical protein [Streptomyces sp. NE06-03C]MDX3606759.1 hypothetical protein [Streptomyces sp. FL06-04B]MDX3739554.1 hypothetical protein [Streptomyces sp. ID01-15D]